MNCVCIALFIETKFYRKYKKMQSGLLFEIEWFRIIPGGLLYICQGVSLKKLQVPHLVYLYVT